MAVCDQGRGCSCELHEKRRQYARKRYAEKKDGEVTIPPPATPRATTRNPQSGKRMEHRFVERVGSEGTIYHWMPKEGDSFSCPDCGAKFQNEGGEWTACS